MSIFPPTATRAEKHTPRAINLAIREQTARRVEAIAHDPAAICQRLAELDREWDIERCLETGSASLTLTGVVLGSMVNRKWLLLSLAVQSFFLQHALQGWCPPLPVFRRLGVRTQREIEAERHALKALLGDYDQTDADGASPLRALDVALT